MPTDNAQEPSQSTYFLTEQRRSHELALVKEIDHHFELLDEEEI